MTDGIGVVIAVMPTAMAGIAVIARFDPPTPMDTAIGMAPGITVLLGSTYKLDFDLKPIIHGMGSSIAKAHAMLICNGVTLTAD